MTLATKYFSFTKALSDGINLYFKNLKVLFPIIGIAGLAAFIIFKVIFPDFQAPYYYYIETIINNAKNTVNYKYQGNTNIDSEHLISLILLSIYKAFMINFCLKLYDSKDKTNTSSSDFLNLNFDLFAYLIARLRYVVTSAAGLLLFIIPGLVWIPRYFFANYLIIDRKLPVSQSFSASWELTYGVKRKLWLFIFIKKFIFNLFVFSFMSLTSLLIYLILYVPMTIFAEISIYRQLSASKQTM